VFFWLKTPSSLTICLMFDGSIGLEPSFIICLQCMKRDAHLTDLKKSQEDLAAQIFSS
jgi:hypothetical protein